MLLFVLSFTLFMAYISVISLAFSFLLSWISGWHFPVSNFYVVGLFALLNVGAAAWLGVSYYRFKELAVKSGAAADSASVAAPGTK
jgi:ABC-type transport system involved in cytochrome c biogenesis permease subunit